MSERLSDQAVLVALRADKAGEAVLVSWTCRPFSSNMDGYTADVHKVTVKYKVGEVNENEAVHEISYVVKTGSDKGPEFNKFFNTIHAKECLFYGQVIPALEEILVKTGFGVLGFPRCFNYNTAPGEEFIFMEDLKEMGFAMQDKKIGIDADHTFLVLKELAKLHAASIVLQMSHDEMEARFPCVQKEWTREFNLGTDFGGFIDKYLALSDVLFEKMGNCEDVRKWVAAVRPKAWQMYEEMIARRSPFTIITHGDPWINNFLFRYDGEGKPCEVRLFDMQGVRLASLALDLQHLFNINLTDEVRRPNLHTFLASYHSMFSEVVKASGVPMPFTLDELKEEYTSKGFYGLLYGIAFLPNMVRRPEEDIDFLVEEEDGQRANLLRMVDSNPYLRPRLMSVVQEWTECGVIST